ncbi:MAG: TIGR01212 family radical SAM protein [Erysipelotrichaceae bacterium]|nr:TIGR01212 family radical SAM protein [Erysipelotrichaceae bacterium]
MINPYPLSEDNKRYQTMNYYTKKTYGSRVYKVPLEAGFTCPNRDGTKATGGCVFCAGGSNSFPEISQKDLREQYRQRKEIFGHKWPQGLPMAYFQSYSNTYKPLAELKELYQPFIDDDQVFGLVIATRCDCLDQEKIGYLQEVARQKEVWLELGLQSIHDQTLREMNRQETFDDFLVCIDRLQNTVIKTSVHLINGWPSESEEMMLETARVVGKLPITAVKIHMLHVLRNTPLGNRYQQEPFELLSKQQYTELVARQITLLREDMVVERVTGDGLASELLAPLWTIKKVSVINDIDKILAANNWWQGKYQ